MNPTRIEPGARWSQAVIDGSTVYIAGQVANAPVPDSALTQTQQVLANIDRLLAQAGSDKTKILSATIWLSDMKHYADFNAAWDAWMDRAHPPARACVQSVLARSEWKVEIMVTARV